MDYDIDSLFKSNIPEAIELPDLGISPGLQNAFDQSLDPSTIGTGEVGTQFENLGKAQALITIQVGDNIQKALDRIHILGGGKVLILNGTHTVNYDIQIYSSTTLEGENSETAIIDFAGSSKQVKAVGTSAYSTGTVSVSANGTTVTGVGTSWTANATAGQSILLGGVWYPISVVTDNTHITIAIPFADVALAGATYTIATYVQDILISKLVIKNSAISAVKFQYANESVLDNINIQTSLVGIDCDTCSQIQFVNIDCTANYTNYSLVNTHFYTFDSSSSIDSLASHGVVLNSCSNFAISTLFSLNSAIDGINITSCSNGRIDGVFAQNAGQGIELVSGNTNIVLLLARVEGNASDGIKLTATSDNVFIQSLFLKNNGGYGINIAASSCDNAVITGNNFSGNVTAAANDSGTGTVIRGNIGLSDNGTSGPSQIVRSYTAGEAITANDAVVIPGTSVVFDATSKGSAVNPATLTVSHTMGSAANGILTVSIAWFDSSAKTLDTVTFNGVSMTLGTSNSNGSYKHSIWSLVAPASGAHNIVATWSGAINDNAMLIGNSYTGAKQTGQPDSVATNSSASATSLTTNITTVLAGCMIMDSFLDIDNTGAPTAGSSQTERNTQTSGSGFLIATSDQGNANSMQYTKNGVAGRLLHLLFAISPFVTGGKIYRASASTANLSNSFLGFAKTAISADAVGDIVISGEMTGLTGVSAGSRYYLSNSSGAISTSVGTVTRKVGIGTSSSTILVTNIW